MKIAQNFKLCSSLSYSLDHITISDIRVLGTLEWDVELLNELFIPHDVDNILRLPARHSDLDDALIWR